MAHQPAATMAETAIDAGTDADAVRIARELWEEIEPDAKELPRNLRERLAIDLAGQLEHDGEAARTQENERYRSRHGEVSKLIETSTLEKLERELSHSEDERFRWQGFQQRRVVAEIQRDIERQRNEINRRKTHYREIRDQLAAERERILETVLPRRYALRGKAQVLPLTVEIHLPREAS